MKPRKKPIVRNAPPKRSTKRIRARKADPKRRRWAKHRCEPFTDWIKEQGCLICAGRPVDPAHVDPKSLGADDVDNVIPLCRFHHDQQEGKTPAFEKKYGINLKEVAKNYTELWRGEFGEAA